MTLHAEHSRMAHMHVVIAVREAQAERYRQNLTDYKDIDFTLKTSLSDALVQLEQHNPQVDALVLDNGLEGVYDLVSELRPKYRRLLILLVDEEADFAMPGAADEISTDPFTDDDLVRRINRLMSDRRLETLRADLMPPVRDFAKRLRKAVGESEKQEAAVSACRDLGYDYVAFYQIDSLEPLQISRKLHDSAIPLRMDVPLQASADDLVSWVAKTGQSRAATSADDLNHLLVKAGRFKAAACTPVGTTSRYGVIVACCDTPFSQQQIMMLELISAQLAAIVAKE